MHRVVFDAGAIARFLHHLQVVHRALPEPCGLEHLALALELVQPLLELVLDIADRDAEFVGGRHKVLGREDVDFESFDKQLAGEWIDFDDTLDLVAEELDADRDFFICRKDLERVAADSERSADQRHIVAVVLDVDQLADDFVAP